MLFDYRTKFDNFSNEHLLQIMTQPSAYQKDVVAIAKEILEERGVDVKEALRYKPQTQSAEDNALTPTHNIEIEELTQILQPDSKGFWTQSKDNFRQLIWSKTKNVGLIVYRIALVLLILAQIYLFLESYPRLQYLIDLSLAGAFTWGTVVGILLGHILKIFLVFFILTLRKSGWYVVLFVSMVGLIALAIRVVILGMMSADGMDELYQFVLCGLLLLGALSKEPLILYKINRRQMQIGVGVIASLCVVLQILLNAFMYF